MLKAMDSIAQISPPNFVHEPDSMAQIQPNIFSTLTWQIYVMSPYNSAFQVRNPSNA
jgi:hypothetical protein